jgi:quinol-cytochrome oxidoreductase complex cytochrome b subunit
MNVLTVIPFVGNLLASFLYSSSLIVLNKIFFLHFALGFVLLLVVLTHILVLHIFSSTNPALNSYASVLYPFYPVVIIKDILVLFLFLFTVFGFFYFVEPDSLGNVDNNIPANPLATPQHILPEWYLLLFYCCLRAFPDKLVGFLIVLVLVAQLLVAFPYTIEKIRVYA